MRYKSLPESAGYVPPCAHIPAGGAGLVHHYGSGAIVAHVPAWAAWLVAPIRCASTVKRIRVEAEQNSDGFHGAMYFDIFLNCLPDRHLINPENPLKQPSPLGSRPPFAEAIGQPWVPHGGRFYERVVVIGVAYVALAIETSPVLRLSYLV